ncbi:MAG: hypothetical protein JWQ38_2364 [Flavipsychrobacter sp.]|nr:hypothetical protein [Flavipsychrobacter sp.]
MRILSKVILLVMPAMVIVIAPRAFGDDKKQKHKVDRKAWSPYACCHDMNAIEHTPTLITEHYLVPEFYYIDSLHKGDTSFVYECYDNRDSILNMDTVQDFDQVRYISLLKKYTDHEHTYRDNDGSRKPLPVSVISKRYDKLGKNKWMSIGYPGNKYQELKEYKNDIVKIDSFMEKTPSGNEIILSIYQYYKVAQLK